MIRIKDKGALITLVAVSICLLVGGGLFWGASNTLAEEPPWSALVAIGMAVLLLVKSTGIDKRTSAANQSGEEVKPQEYAVPISSTCKVDRAH